QSDQQTAIGYVMHRRGDAFLNQGTHEIAVPSLGRQIHRRRGAFLSLTDLAQIHGLPEPSRRLAKEQDCLVRSLEGEGGGFCKISDQTDAANGGGRENGAAIGLVV